MKKIGIILVLMLSVASFNKTIAQNIEGKRIHKHSNGSDLEYFETCIAYNSEFYFKFFMRATYVDDTQYKYKLVGAKVNIATGKWIKGVRLRTLIAKKGSGLWNKIAFQKNMDNGINSVIVLSNGHVVVAGKNFLIELDKDLNEIKNYREMGHDYVSLVEDIGNKKLIAGYVYKGKQVGTMIIDLEKQSNEWNEPSFEPYSPESDRTFPVKNNKVVKVLSQFSGSVDDGEGAYGQRILLIDNSDFSIIKKTLTLDFNASHPAVSKNGVLVGNDSKDDQSFLVLHDVLNDSEVKRIYIDEQEEGYVDHITWVNDDLFEMYQTKSGYAGNKWSCVYTISSYNASGKEVKSKRKMTIYKNKTTEPNYSKSIDGAYEMISDIGKDNNSVTFIFKK